jgi:uncharacterized protein YhaN
VKLKRLIIDRLPGINQSFAIDAAGAGFHVVFGPNAIGKSSLCRAVEGLYWEDRGSSSRTSVTGEFELDGESWRAERDGSRVRWQRGGEASAAPNLPAPHNHRYFFLRLLDLIDPSADGTHDIASEIRRQMSGGFDLDQIAADLFAGIGARHGRRERSEFNSASHEVQKAEGEQGGLQRRADQLDALREQLDSVEISARRLVAVGRALDLAGRLGEFARATAEIVALPEGLANLTGKEVEQVEQLQDQIDTLDERVRVLEGQRDTARDVKRDAHLGAPLDEAALAIWRENGNELGRVELALGTAKTELRASQNALASALSACGGGNVDEAALDLAAHGQLFEFLRAVEGHGARLKAIQERLRLLTHVDRPEESQRALKKLRYFTNILRSWLRAPEPETFSDRIRGRRSWVLLAIAMTVVGAGLAAFVAPMFALLAAAGVGVAVPVFILRKSNAFSGARAIAEDAFGKLGEEEPEAWDVPSVESRLRSIEGEIATLGARMQRVRDRDVERRSLESEFEGLTEIELGLEERRKALADSLKLEVIPPNAELVDFARALDQLRMARISAEDAAGKVDELEEKRTALLSYLADVLQCHEEVQPEDAKTAIALLDQLARRNARLRKAISDEKATHDQLEQNAADRKRSLDAAEKIYVDASLENDDFPGLKALLNAWPYYLKLKSDATRLDGQIDLDRNVLAQAGEAALAEYDCPRLEALQAKLFQAVEKASRLRDEIADINVQVNEAKRGSDIQDLIVVREDARTKLQDCRDEALFSRAGKFLIASVEAEYEKSQMPRVFERARDHFSAFTNHKYELRLSREANPPQLFAVELRTGQGQRLAELSDGTRAQLLLAARIAFAAEVEGGRTLPLFLDEALDQSDPERFEAIVRSLGRVASDQERQIFYLTSDPYDVERIRRALAQESYEIAVTIDLGSIRANVARVSDPLLLHVPPRQKIPEPEALSAEAYGAALGVPNFQPLLGFAAQHFFYLLPDALDFLYDLLTNSIERAGQWETVRDSALADRLCSGGVSSYEITARTELLRVFCELWKQGRGRLVDREVLENSGSLRERYLDDVATVSSELDGDPLRILAFLKTNKDPRLKGFRKASIEGLERYLLDNGYIDDQPILTEADFRLRCLASPAGNKLPTRVESDLLHQWWMLAQRENGLALSRNENYAAELGGGHGG